MTTVKNIISIKGIGIHSGNPVNMKIKPSKKEGIFFRRVDIKGSDYIEAKFTNVTETKFRNTTIGSKKTNVKTIEHLMAALFINGIDSVLIDINNSETPILDGSALEFCDFLKKDKSKNTMKKIIIKKEIVVNNKDLVKSFSFFEKVRYFIFNLFKTKPNNYIKISPYNKGLHIKVTLDYKDKIIGLQSVEYIFDNSEKSFSNFIKNFANCRTFGKYSEWEFLKKHGMARGASEKNVIALNSVGDGTINKLHKPDEFVRHKVIDILGDLFTSGGFIYGKLDSYKGSHALNNILLKKIFSDKSNYDIVG